VRPRSGYLPEYSTKLASTPWELQAKSTAARVCVSELRDACHGVPGELDTDVMHYAAEFFALPAEQKNALASVNSRHFRGYTAVGGEQTKGVNDWREQLDVGPEEAAADVDPDEPPWRCLRGPNQWPAALPALKGAVLAWMQAMDRVGLAVLRALALGLGQPVDHFDAVVLPRGDPHLKLIRYPHHPAAERGNQGVGLHHDSGLVSFVLQDSAGGQNADPADPIFATFGDNYLKIRLRSHRDVARAHYADLADSFPSSQS
jgi:isopenicillin N synthase-like dioxygenase